MTRVGILVILLSFLSVDVSASPRLKVRQLDQFTYNGKPGICEKYNPRALRQGEVATAPGPSLPVPMRSDLAVLGIKHMVVQKGGKQVVRVIAKIRNTSDRPMRNSSFKVLFRIGGESYPCLATLPQLQPGRMMNLSREVVLRRGLNYRVTVIADFLEKEQEASESNNRMVYTIRMK